MNLTSESTSNSTDHQELLYCGFNQDSGCFACGTVNGFIIFNVEPFRETFRRIFPNGGIGIIEMLFRCNLLAIVGGGRNPRYPTNKVMIWDDHQNKCIGELKFRTEVKAVKLRRDRIVVVLETKVFVYRFKDLKLIDQITTIANPKGLVSLCPDKNNVLAIPGLAKGSIRIELYDISKATLIKAHDADLAQFTLNFDGSRIASASEKGTLIRLWNCYTGEPLRELRRGMDRADIYCIAFNTASTYIACSSDKGTIHIFSLLAPPPTKTEGGGGPPGSSLPASPSPAQPRWASLDSTPPPPGSFSQSPLPAGDMRSISISSRHDASRHDPYSFRPSDASSHSLMPKGGYPGKGDIEEVSLGGAANSASGNNNNNNNNNKSMSGMGINFLKGILPSGFVPKYLESEWSFAQVRGIEGKAICAFSKDSTKLHIICSDGNFVIANVEEGECSRVSTMKYLKSIDEIQNEEEEFEWNNNHGASASTSTQQQIAQARTKSSSNTDLASLASNLNQVSLNNHNAHNAPGKLYDI